MTTPPAVKTFALVLAQGSRAGTRTPIHPGYYMIGRAAECQIRPKSRSVSRRHCLVHHQDERLRVMDLDSTSGTTVNQQRLEPLSWKHVDAGDLVRCGKVAFEIAQEVADADRGEEFSSYAPPTGDGADEPPIVRGEAWEEFDIAAFLEGQDDEDRERRYADIRRRDAESKARDEDEEFEEHATGAEPPSRGQGAGSAATDSAATEFAKRPAKPNKHGMNRLPKKKKQAAGRSINWPGFGPGDERWKLVAIGLVAAIVVGYLGYQLYRFQSGPDVQVIEGID